ncbi:MAG: trimethylamine methyltransferase family protein, partial [Pseudomonadota bacterium]
MSRSKRRTRKSENRPERGIDYHNIINPFAPMRLYSDDYIENMHKSALAILAERGVKVLLREARDIFKAAGAIIDGEFVYLGKDIVDAALASAPKSFTIHGGVPEKDLHMRMGQMAFQPGGAAPHATDRITGRRPGRLADFHDMMRITQHFDVLQMISPAVEPQDIPIHIRHYATTRAQLAMTNKIPFIFSRGKPQVDDTFKMIQIARG